MEFERACYSISKLNKAVEMVKAMNWTVKRKNQHFGKCMEVTEIYQYCSENLNCLLFDPELDLKDYRNASYNYKEWKLEELNKMLKRKRLYLCNELNGIKTSIATGEVDSME